MNNLDLIYFNADFKTLINFKVKSALDYNAAFQKYGGTKYIPNLLKSAKETIQQYGVSLDFPMDLLQNMSDDEFDYFLLLLEKNIDTLIYEHIYVKLTSKHASSLLNIYDDRVFRANGIGIDSVLLAGLDENSDLTIQLPTIQELQKNYIITVN